MRPRSAPAQVPGELARWIGATRPAPPIATLTLQPSLDVSYEVDTLQDDRKLHASRYRVDPGGNGINVARALHRLGLASHACVVAAGDLGTAMLRLLRRELPQVHGIRADGQTRINATVEQHRPPSQYELIGQGPPLGDDTLRRAGRQLRPHGAGGLAVLTGLPPQGRDASLYCAMARELRAQATRVVLDMPGAELARVLEFGAMLIKPNRWEFEQLTGRELPRLEDVQREACALRQRSPVDVVCVSLGAQGALLACAQGVWYGEAPPVDVRSTVGAGDSMLAGLLAGLACGAAAAQALRLGLACGSATAAQPGTELFDPAQLPPLLERLRVRQLG